MIIYQYRILVFDGFDYEKENFRVYIYLYTYVTVSWNSIKKFLSRFLQVFDPLFKPYVGSYSIGTCFSQDLFEWWGLESKKFNLQSVRRFWSWKINASGYLFSESGYSFTASGYFFQHPDTFVTTVQFFAISCAISSLIHFDSLYSFLKNVLMLIGLISEHYIEL